MGGSQPDSTGSRKLRLCASNIFCFHLRTAVIVASPTVPATDRAEGFPHHCQQRLPIAPQLSALIGVNFSAPRESFRCLKFSYRRSFTHTSFFCVRAKAVINTGSRTKFRYKMLSARITCSRHGRHILYCDYQFCDCHASRRIRPRLATNVCPHVTEHCTASLVYQLSSTARFVVLNATSTTAFIYLFLMRRQ